MGEDEKGTLYTLNAYKEVMTKLIQQYRGRVVDAPWDNVLAEFGSVVDAVQSAVEIQKELKTRNANLPENRKMEFRIGVNLGMSLRMDSSFWEWSQYCSKVEHKKGGVTAQHKGKRVLVK